VQVPHGLGLRAQYVVESVGGEGADDAVVQDARAMHDGGQRAAVEQGGQGGPVGGVAGGEFDLGAQFRQLRQELGGAGGVGAGAAGEQQVACAVPGHEVSGDGAAERAGAAGDQYGAVGVERGRDGEDDLADV